MEQKDTLKRLYSRYNSYTRRPTVRNERARRIIFRVFERTLRLWLPTDITTPILDAGCGEGTLLAFLRERGYTNLSGFDLSPENVSICHSLGFDFVRQGDILQLVDNYPSNHFGLILFIDVLEHLPKQRVVDAIEQMRACLCSGGSLIIQTPNMGCVLGTYYRYNDLSHEFGLTEKTARELLIMAGFHNDDIEIRPAWNATTMMGHIREFYLLLLHNFIFLGEGARRPKIPTINLLIRATVS